MQWSWRLHLNVLNVDSSIGAVVTLEGMRQTTSEPYYDLL